MSSSERFGYEWQKYSKIDPNYYEQFTKWVYPLTAADFTGRSVLDAGCGMGRNSYWAKKWGAKTVTAFDFDQRSIASASRNLSGLPGVTVNFENIYDLKYENQFDITMCIGVIHHLENPKLAIKNLIQATRPSGKIVIWVYGYEGNEWLVRYVSPARKMITSKLPVGLVHLLAYLLSLPVWLYIKIFPNHSPYFHQLSKFKFSHVHSIVFDQLIPTVANYWRESEALGFFSDFKEDIGNLKIYHVNNNSWTVIGEKKNVAEVQMPSPMGSMGQGINTTEESFSSWNEKMALKYNPDRYHNSRNFFIRFLSRWRTRLIIKLLAIQKDDEILDLGCGAGNMLAAMNQGRLTGVDLSSSLIEAAEKKLAGRNITLLVGSVEDLPVQIRAKKYDKIFSSEVIEHLEHPDRMIASIMAITKPESLIAISFPNEHLVARIKKLLLKFGLFKFLFPGLSPRMTDEWHLHEIRVDYFKKLIAGKLRVVAIKKIPFPFLPLHYIFLCQKI